MKLRVSHLTRYGYDKPVGFSPHTLYLRPRESAVLRLENYSLVVQPESKITHGRDAHDNNMARVHIWENGETLTINSSFIAHTLECNPFDFFLTPEAIPFPFAYPASQTEVLAPYRRPPSPETQAALSGWLAKHMPDPPEETVPFLSRLAGLVFEHFSYSRREEAGIQTPVETIRLGSGTCRDFAMFMCELLRTLGLATRFVSGYLYAPPEDDHRSRGAMHAWMEVHLPGAGWKAIDPTHGVFCDDCFIPVACAVVPTDVTPVQGGIAASSGATATMTADILIEKLG